MKRNQIFGWPLVVAGIFLVVFLIGSIRFELQFWDKD